MGIRFTQESENIDQKEREKVRTSWEIFKTNSLVQAVHKAKELGWKDQLIQVRGEKIGEDEMMYYIEPFETDCRCKGILKYSDFFD